jgi:hypothetical protein
MGQLTERRQALVDALRSGRYQQTNGALCVVSGPPMTADQRATRSYCCLGVATDLVKEKLGLRERVLGGGRAVVKYADGIPDGMLPSTRREVTSTRLLGCVQRHYGFTNNTGWSRAVGTGLAIMNDEGRDFKQIAEFIVEHQNDPTFLVQDPDGSRIV